MPLVALLPGWHLLPLPLLLPLRLRLPQRLLLCLGLMPRPVAVAADAPGAPCCHTSRMPALAAGHAQVGGGPTGVEIAAELMDLVEEDVARKLPHIEVRRGGTWDQAGGRARQELVAWRRARRAAQ